MEVCTDIQCGGSIDEDRLGWGWWGFEKIPDRLGNLANMPPGHFSARKAKTSKNPTFPTLGWTRWGLLERIENLGVR
jgi:hypothetical protein